ncbi:MAG TPA: hypothetical protein VK776_13220 [Bryobacteraceae bacterium]|nr:hypothetical protein [Bryobacteraceae bacterium]
MQFVELILAGWGEPERHDRGNAMAFEKASYNPEHTGYGCLMVAGFANIRSKAL